MVGMLGYMAVMGGAAVLTAKLALEQRRANFLLLSTQGDEDIKIAGGSFGKEKTNEDYADQAAEEFLRQKEAGNIEEASRLGQLLARELWSDAQELIMNQGDEYTPTQTHQRILLYSYCVNSFLADSAPQTLLGEMALSGFYSELEGLSSVLYTHVSDTASFSLYILNHRANRQGDAVGRIYAKLSGGENDPALIKEGNQLYGEFYKRCEEVSAKHIKYNL